jgi:hypothetical protein
MRADLAARLCRSMSGKSRREVGVTGVAGVAGAVRYASKPSQLQRLRPLRLDVGASRNHVSDGVVWGVGDPSDIAERAAIAEFEGGIPRPYADEFAFIQAECPNGVDKARWEMAVQDAGAFLDRWGQIAFSFGWPVADIFDWTNRGASGLVWEIQEGEVTKLTDDQALIEDFGRGRIAWFARPIGGEQ